MKIKLLCSIASAEYSHKGGDIVDLPDGQALCDAGLAEPVDPPAAKKKPVKRQRKKKAVKRGKETAAFK